MAALGLSFKPETDDVREAPSIHILQDLIRRGAKVQAFDPQAMHAAASLLPEVTMCEDAYAACRDSDVLVIMTEWNQFRMLDLKRVKGLLRRPAIADLRNIYHPGPMRAAGFTYVSVGR